MIDRISNNPTARNTTAITNCMTPFISPLGAKICFRMPTGPFSRHAQINQKRKNSAPSARVVLRSAFTPRNSGRVILNICSVVCPQPTLPIPGNSPSQLEQRIKMKKEASSQNVFCASFSPIISVRKRCRKITSDSTAPVNIVLRPARTCWRNRTETAIKINAASHPVSIELVTGTRATVKMTGALADRCSPASSLAETSATTGCSAMVSAPLPAT